MKKYIIIAVLMAAAIGASAQMPDTIPSIRDLAATNRALQEHSRAVGTSVAMVGIGATIDVLGVVTLMKVGSPQSEKIGKAAIFVGSALALASVIPVSLNRVKLDGRGLVIELDNPKKKR